jgi:DNA-binding transcriptional ArsR family regulator
MNKPLTRDKAANACIDVLDTEFFSALCEPVRVQLVRALVLNGRSDIQTLARDFSQDRSVISRHLQVMERAGLVVSEKIGRHQYFELDGPTIVDRVESILDLMREIVPICCPGKGA